MVFPPLPPHLSPPPPQSWICPLFDRHKWELTRYACRKELRAHFRVRPCGKRPCTCQSFDGVERGAHGQAGRTCTSRVSGTVVEALSTTQRSRGLLLDNMLMVPWRNWGSYPTVSSYTGGRKLHASVALSPPQNKAGFHTSHFPNQSDEPLRSLYIFPNSIHQAGAMLLKFFSSNFLSEFGLWNYLLL